MFFAVVVSLVLRAGVGGGFGSELLLLESSLNRHPSLTPQSSILNFGLFGFSEVWCGLFVGPVQNAAGEDRTPDLRIMRPTRCQLRYCRMCLHCGHSRCPLFGNTRCVIALGLVSGSSGVGQSASWSNVWHSGLGLQRSRFKSARGLALDCGVHSASWWFVPRPFPARILRVVRRFASLCRALHGTSWCNGNQPLPLGGAAPH